MPRRPRLKAPIRTDIPDWRDPQMPLCRNYTMMNGSKLTEVSPEFEQRFRQHGMDISPMPNWRDDPTYYHIDRICSHMPLMEHLLKQLKDRK